MGDGATQCQAAISALTRIQDSIKSVQRLRQNLGGNLFLDAGGAWQGNDANSFKPMLGSMQDQEAQLSAQTANLVSNLTGLLGQLSSLGV